ncbi:MAG TPA: hypothetical protein VJM80_10355 [bacterium]|nr:hypothetical protein [bacterium]
MVVEREKVAEVLSKSQMREEKEEKVIEELRSGRTTLEIYGFANTLKNLGLKEES